MKTKWVNWGKRLTWWFKSFFNKNLGKTRGFKSLFLNKNLEKTQGGNWGMLAFGQLQEWSVHAVLTTPSLLLSVGRLQTGGVDEWVM